MEIKNKIEYIERFTGLVFLISYYDFDHSDGLVGKKLLEMKVITQDTLNKLKTIKPTNFWDNYSKNKPLNSNSILLINLIYNLIKIHEKKLEHFMKIINNYSLEQIEKLLP